MLTEVGRDDVGRRYCAALYTTGCLTALPWGQEPFDCVVFLFDPSRIQALAAELSAELARANVDWVQVTGNGADALHDAIDRASVDAGRQQVVGDGSPMTSWHTEAQSVEQMAEVASHCFGGQKQVLVLVVGQAQEFEASIKAIQQGIRCRCGESINLRQ